MTHFFVIAGPRSAMLLSARHDLHCHCRIAFRLYSLLLLRAYVMMMKGRWLLILPVRTLLCCCLRATMVIVIVGSRCSQIVFRLRLSWWMGMAFDKVLLLLLRTFGMFVFRD